MVAVLALFFVLPVLQVFVWLLMLAVNPAALKKRWPHVSGLALALACGLVATVIYLAPRSLEAYEGGEADPSGIYTLALAFNAGCGVAVALVLWGISLTLPPSQVKAAGERTYRPPVI